MINVFEKRLISWPRASLKKKNMAVIVRAGDFALEF